MNCSKYISEEEISYTLKIPKEKALEIIKKSKHIKIGSRFFMLLETE